MHVAALPESFRENFHDRPFKPRMIVADGENHAPQPPSFQTEQKVLPAGGTLPIGHLHAEHLAPALPIRSRWPRAQRGSGSLRSPAAFHSGRRGSGRDIRCFESERITALTN